jgi:hypothetical protein
MRFFVGFILGVALTIVAVYASDLGAQGTEEKRIVNWDVVSEKVNTLTAEGQKVWADFTHEITGPE